MTHKNHNRELTKKQIMDRYGLTPALIGRCLPPPRKVRNPYYKNAAPILLWKEADVRRAVHTNPEIKKLMAKRAEKAKKAERKIAKANDFLAQFSPEMLLEDGKDLTRHFILHIGPTNSGKTYSALKRLKESASGVYLGPLRLLALEMYETLNEEGYPCTLLTGEEYIDMPGASFFSSTIELCDYNEQYEVAVIDEAQMIADPFRGPHWLRAISLVNAYEVHICLAPEAEEIMCRLMDVLDPDYEIVRHERMVPLEFSGMFRDITEVMPGDALIAFSRKKVLQLAAVLEKEGIRASVIYGALPPSSRREEVRRFVAKETTVVVATDAIGMGISLPIRRIIFVENEKFDGTQTRKLLPSEIRQIAGRAGRFGKYDLGEVLSMQGPRLIEQGLKGPIDPITKLTLGFPEEALEYDHPLADMLTQWNQLQTNPIFVREDMSDAVYLLNQLKSIPKHVSKAQIYSLITCPIDIKSRPLVNYWKLCCQCIFENAAVPRPNFSEVSLESCELQYHAYDVYHQILRRIGIEDDCMQEKLALSEKINAFLKSEKSGFLKRCRICGKEMSIKNKFSICNSCYYKEQLRTDW